MERPSFSKPKKSPQIWAVASGKGGVGKTFISASLGITLSKLSHSVLIIDLDTTGANVHTTLGTPPASLSLRHWVEEKMQLTEVITNTSIPRLSFIQGTWDSWSSSVFTKENARSLMEEVVKLRYDYVIVDLGPGPQEYALEIMECADEKIVVANPEPTSIEKNYRFLEAHICNGLRSCARPEAFNNLIKELQAYRHKKLKKPFSFREFLKKNEGFMIDHFEALNKKPVRLLVNSSRGESDAVLGHSIKSVCSKYYDLSLDYLGAIEYDNAVWQSVRNREPVLVAQPFTPLAGQFLHVCKHLIAPEELSAVG